MRTQIPITHFAPAERMPIELIHRQTAAVSETPLVKGLLNSGLNFIFILNKERQIVFATDNCAQILARAPDKIFGLRPGEALDCKHATDLPGGCGTSEFCRECGAAQAILACLSGNADVKECRITRIINCAQESLDLLVCASPFEHQGERYAIFSVMDVSHEKRRRALERIFFHDLINVAGGLTGLAELLVSSAPAAMKSDLNLMQSGLQMLLEEIQSQKDLVAAEQKELAVNWEIIESRPLLILLEGIYQNQSAAKDRQLDVAPDSADVTFVSDSRLLKRVLGNLIKNALEATPRGGRISYGCNDLGHDVRFWVQNPNEMAREVQLQVFNRSFSTKGVGRGLGTYSVKLLTEQYLHGKVSFRSSRDAGTIFYVDLPKHQHDSEVK
jgi:signal transduction histidine kinase